MAKAGDTIHLLFEFTDSDGNGRYFADKTAFEAAFSPDPSAGVSAIYYERLGVETALTYAIRPIPEADEWEAATAYSIGDRIIPVGGGEYMLECTTAGTSHADTEPTWDTTIGETTADGAGALVWTTRAIRGLHDLTYEAEAGQSLILIRKPYNAGSNPQAWQDDIQTADLDSIRAAINASIASPGVLTAQDVDLGAVTSGDSYRSDVLYVPEELAQQIYGTDDLTGYLITAACKFAPTDEEAISLDVDWVTDGSDRAFRLEWEEMPAAIVTQIGTAESVVLYIDVQTTDADGDVPFTGNKYTMRVVWDRNPPAPAGP
jgi:hypothetical protein